VGNPGEAIFDDSGEPEKVQHRDFDRIILGGSPRGYCHASDDLKLQPTSG
jgi:hypothetical protein